MNKIQKIQKELESKSKPAKIKIMMYYFKTGKGEYGEGDVFLGLTSQEIKNVAQKYYDLSFTELSKLLNSKIHEERICALRILVHNYKKDNSRKEIYDFYLKNTKKINNWDLVDISAHYIVGDYLYQRTVLKRASPRTVLFKLAKSKNLWERRIAMISTFAFIYKGEYKWTFKIAKMLIKDQEDLIHKASGWMLREVGKRVSETKLKAFLDTYGTKMPRTMLRYTIERLPEAKRKYYLNKK